jgi:hypothetical protein
MNLLISELIKGIQHDDEEAFVGASEIAAASCIGFDKYDAIYPFNVRLAEGAPSSSDVEALKNTLIEYLGTSKGPSIGAIFALGKFNDPLLLPLFRELLMSHLTSLLEYKAAK